ncbi:MAG: TIGR02594 family protein [Pseudomonadota bacterium]
MMSIELMTAIQMRLSNLGWYAGRVDGREGDLTALAVTDFKRAAGLRARPKIGPITLTRLFASNAPRRPATVRKLSATPWLDEARRLLGVREAEGARNNPAIMDWADALDMHYPGDDVPWCGLFMAHVMAVGAPLDAQNFNRLTARLWLTYGRPVEPQIGAVLVFWRVARDSWQGHVGLYMAEDDEAYHVLGGNQGDAVSVVRIAKDRLLGARYPKSFAPTGKRRRADKNTGVFEPKLSINEA